MCLTSCQTCGPAVLFLPGAKAKALALALAFSFQAPDLIELHHQTSRPSSDLHVSRQNSKVHQNSSLRRKHAHVPSDAYVFEYESGARGAHAEEPEVRGRGSSPEEAGRVSVGGRGMSAGL